MADKKEIIDFLRNRQKAIEIRSKSNGINLWVLMAAISAIGWMAIDLYYTAAVRDRSVVASFLLMFQSAFYTYGFASSAGRESAEIRYLSVGSSPYPALSLLLSLWNLIPSLLFLAFVGVNINSVVVGLFSLFVFVLTAISIYRMIFPGNRVDKFPDPKFLTLRGPHIAFSIIISAIFLFFVIESIIDLRRLAGAGEELIKFSCLISAMYLMICFAISKKIENGGLDWTYEMEADLVLGLISADVAARKIEHRSLGVRLAQVMDDFYDEMDKKIQKIEKEIQVALNESKEVCNIPEEYAAERKSRWNEAAGPSLSLIEDAVSEMRRLVDYLKKIEAQAMNARLKEAVEIHSARGNECADRLIEMSKSLKEKTFEIIPKK